MASAVATTEGFVVAEDDFVSHQAETSAATVAVTMEAAVETMSMLMIELAAETRAGAVVASAVAMMGAILIAQR